MSAVREIPARETRFQAHTFKTQLTPASSLPNSHRRDLKHGFPLCSLRKNQPLQSKYCLPQLASEKAKQTYRCLSDPAISSPAVQAELCLGNCPPPQDPRAASWWSMPITGLLFLQPLPKHHPLKSQIEGTSLV